MILRDWLIIAGAVILFIIVLDGLRRMRNRGQLRLDIDAELIVPEVEDCNGELPNGGARLAKVQQSDAGMGRGAEPVSGPEPRKGVRADSANAVEPPAEGAEVDLLLDQELKGVGQGADRWLSPQEPEDGAADAALFPDERPGRDSAKQPASFEADSVDDAVVSEQLKSRDTELEYSRRSEEADDADAGLSGKRDLRDDQQLVDQFSETWQAEMHDAAAERPTANRDAPLFSESDATPLEAHGISADADVTTENAPDPSGAPALEVVGASGDDLDLNQPVSLLVEQVRARESSAQADPRPSESASQSAASDRDAAPSALAAERQPAATRKPEPKASSRAPRDERPEVQTSFFDVDPELAPEPVPEPKKTRAAKNKRNKVKKPPQKTPATRDVQDDLSSGEDDVLIITVTAKDTSFSGSALFRLVEACGMDFGDMSLYHRYEDGPAEGAVQFSMANAIKPGTFDPQHADQFSTPAVTFFLNLAEPRERMVAFDCMLATAQCLADHLGGELKDEHRSSLRSQTIEHYRQRLRDYERRRLSKQRS